MSEKPTYEELEKRILELEKAESVCRNENKVLHEQLLHQRTLMDASLDGIAVIDQNHRVRQANKSFSQMLGYGAEEVLGLHTWDFEALMTEAEIRSDFADLEQTQRTFETRHRRKDGTIYDAEVTACGANLGDESMVLTITRDITESRQRERLFEESEANFRTLVENVNAIPWRFDCRDNRFTFIGKQVETILGYPQDSWTDLDSWANRIHPDDRRTAVEFCLGSTSKGKDHDFEYRCLTPENETVWLRDIVSVRKDEKDRPVELIGYMVDISEQKKTEAALEESQTYLSTLFDHVPAGILVIDARTRKIVDANPTAAELIDLPRDQIVGNSCHRFICPAFGQACPILDQGQQVENAERVLLKADGTQVPVIKTVTTAMLNDRSCLVETFVDISQLKQAEKTLGENEQRLQTLVNACPDCVAFKDGQGRWMEANAAALRSLSLTEVAYQGKTDVELAEMVDPAHREAFLVSRETDDKAWREGSISRSEEIIAQPDDGSQRVFDVIKVPLFEEDGARKGLIILGRDITERKRMEEALRQSEDQLAKAMRMAAAGHWHYDVARDTFTFNDNFYRIFRTTAEKVGGYRMSSAEYARRFCHPDDAHIVGEEVRAAIQAGDSRYSRRIEHRILYADGEVGHITVRFFIVKDSQGRTIETYGVNQDITERKRAEERATRFSRVLENSLNEIYIFDAHTLHFTDVNRGARENLGYSMEELRSLTPLDLKPELTAELLDEQIEPLRTRDKEKIDAVVRTPLYEQGCFLEHWKFKRPLQHCQGYCHRDIGYKDDGNYRCCLPLSSWKGPSWPYQGGSGRTS